MKEENAQKAANLVARKQAARQIVDGVEDAETIQISVQNIGTVAVSKNDPGRGVIDNAVKLFCAESINQAIKELVEIGVTGTPPVVVEKVSDIIGFKDEDGYQIADDNDVT